jgi:hypothetical protein
VQVIAAVPMPTVWAGDAGSYVSERPDAEETAHKKVPPKTAGEDKQHTDRISQCHRRIIPR